ncbi:MAG TPA: transglutaminase, partial [Azonexus sp.]|nr:transglutaminase [Azonexus sp.]
EGLSDRDSKLQSLRKILFGVWEMNWIAFNVGTDVELPGRQTRIPFLLLPQLEAQGTLRDGSDPDGFAYAIRVRRPIDD